MIPVEQNGLMADAARHGISPETWLQIANLHYWLRMNCGHAEQSGGQADRRTESNRAAVAVAGMAGRVE
jgi:uncharacterized alpha-E superfamily protein